MCLFFLKLTFIILPLSIYAEDDKETFDNMAYSYCTANKEVAQKCFNLNESQCNTVMSSIVSLCGLGLGVFPISEADVTTIESFDACLGLELEKYLLSVGRSLTDSCEP